MLHIAQITVGLLTIAIGLGICVHGLLYGVIRKKIRNRFLRTMPYATGSKAIALGLLTIASGIFFTIAGTVILLDKMQLI